MKTYDTLSEAVNDLIKRGYGYNFNIKRDCITCLENDINLQPEEFEIDEIHRFEGMTDPGDENILFAISSAQYNLKGTLVNAFGVYADTASAELVVQRFAIAGEIELLARGKIIERELRVIAALFLRPAAGKGKSGEEEN